MSFIFTNPNPKGIFVGDCTIRALAIILERTWRDVYTGLTLQGFECCDMPSSNRVWGEYLKNQGFKRHIIPENYPCCYSVRDFCGEHFDGKYILSTGTHVVAAISGDWYDTWDSGDETITTYWVKESEDAE